MTPAGEEEDGEPAGGAEAHDALTIVREVIDAFNRRDLEAVLERIAPDAVFTTVTSHLIHDGEPYRGHAGVRQYYKDAQRLWRSIRIEPSELQAAGDAAVVIGYAHVSTETTDLTTPTVWTWRLRDGLVTECTVHADAQQARRAVGLDEE